MTNSKSTPGPWRVDSSYYEYREIDSDSRLGIARVLPFGNDSGESAANARLIAAAPDLLNALRGLCDRLGPRWFLEQNWAEPLDAIAKAEGGAA